MNIENLRTAAKLAGMVANPYSMSRSFRSVGIGAGCATAYSEYGNILVSTSELTGLTHTCLVDGHALNSVLTSLPEKGEIVLTDKETTLAWKAGSAKGHLTKIVEDSKTPDFDHPSYPWIPPDDFAEALVLASSACQAASVSIGAYGVVLDPHGELLTIASSNSISLAQSLVNTKDYPFKEKITIRPPVPNVLAAILKSEPGEISLDITDMGIFVEGSKVLAHLPLSTPLTTDLTMVANKYGKHENTTKINAENVKRFLGRANALVDKHASTISIAVEEGQIKLEHKGIAGASEEFFISEGLPKELSLSGVKLPIYLMATALRGVDTAILDYLPDKVLILQGSKPAFRYIISGQ